MVTTPKISKLKAFWNKTSGKVVIIAGFVAALTTIFGGLSSLIGFFKSPKSKGVQIVDVYIGRNDTIDLKLRNTGSEVAYIKSARLHVKKKWKIVPDSGGHFVKVDPTETYQLNIYSEKEAPYTIEVPLSQGIKPNDIDRFRLSLYHHQPGNDNNTYVYLADLELVMDEDNATVKKPDILFAFELPMRSYERMTKGNIDAVWAINKEKGYKSELLTDILAKPPLKLIP